MDSFNAFAKENLESKSQSTQGFLGISSTPRFSKFFSWLKISGRNCQISLKLRPPTISAGRRLYRLAKRRAGCRAMESTSQCLRMHQRRRQCRSNRGGCQPFSVASGFYFHELHIGGKLEERSARRHVGDGPCSWSWMEEDDICIWATKCTETTGNSIWRERSQNRVWKSIEFRFRWGLMSKPDEEDIEHISEKKTILCRFKP